MRCLIAIADNKSINKASSDMYTTPQNVSRLLKQMEDEMGFELVIRKPSGITFTKLGEEVLDVSRQTISRLESIKQKFENEKQMVKQLKGTLNLYCLSAHNLLFIEDFLEIFKQQYPQIIVSLIGETEYSRIYNAVDEEPEINIGIVPYPFINKKIGIPSKYLEEYRFDTLLQDEMILLCSSDFEFHEEKSISINKLKKNKLILCKESSQKDSLLVKIITEYDICLEDIPYIIRSPYNFLGSISKGLGLGLMQKNTLKENDLVNSGKLYALKFKEDTTVCNYLVTSKKIEHSLIQKLFLNEIYRYFNKIIY